MKADVSRAGVSEPPVQLNRTIHQRVFGFTVWAAVVLLASSPLLRALLLHTLQNDFHQHILLVPFLSAYFIYHKARRGVPVCVLKSSILAASSSGFIATLSALFAWRLYLAGALSHNDVLSLGTFSLLAVLFSIALLLLGWSFLRLHLFAIAFLLFAIPLPDAATHAASVFLQHASAHAAFLFLRLSGIPFTSEGLLFHLPGLDIMVAEEYSGFRSTFVLFIASVLAGEILLRRPLSKLLLVVAVLPIAILRNGFRVALISWLTVKVAPGIIQGPLHHRRVLQEPRRSQKLLKAMLQ